MRKIPVFVVIVLSSLYGLCESLPSVSKVSVQLTWSAPDPVQYPDPIASYKVYRNGILLASAVSTSYVDSLVMSSTTYAYYATSIDHSGIESVPSNTATVPVPLSFIPVPPIVNTLIGQ